ncbi:MAG: phytanoyl-CoA dioxygenase family protein [Candidatus Latescibacteria bacterium]|nr:phytanoyl-CoA dioxygenase family protein [Candidatus Latescibacterota bacterium]
MALLSQTQVRFYEDNGYLVIPAVLQDNELEPVRRVITEQVDREARQLYAEGQITDLHEDASFTRRLMEVYHGLKRRSIGWNKEVFSQEIYDLGMHPAILDIAESLVGPEIQFNGDYWVRTKLPNETVTTFPWHQDSGYYGDPTEPYHLLSLWLPLVDVDEHNGCLQVIPGSHRWGLQPVGRDEDGHHRPTEDIETRGRVETLPMKAGDMFAFHNLTFHRSLMNQSDGIRWSIDLRYSAIGVPLEWLFKAGLNGFIAQSAAHPALVDSWEGWQAKRRMAEAARSR